VVTLLKKIALTARRCWPFGQVLSWLRPNRNSPDLRYLGPSTYDEVIYDAKTDTYYGLLYPKELREANRGKPVVIHVVGDDEPAPNGVTEVVHEEAGAESASPSVAETPDAPPPA